MAPGSCGISIQEVDYIWTCTATRKYRSWVMGITVASIGHLLQYRTILRVRAQREYYLVTPKPEQSNKSENRNTSSITTYRRSTFLQLHPPSQFGLNPLTPPLWYFFYRCSLYDCKFCEICDRLDEMVYTLKCGLILKAFGTVQCLILCSKYIPAISLDVIYSKYESRERSEQMPELDYFREGGRNS